VQRPRVASGRPNPNISHAADTLAMLLDHKPAPREVAALDAISSRSAITHERLDFTTRVVASTRRICSRP